MSNGFCPMIYDHFFAAALDRLREEQRYRVFADLERIAGRFPHGIPRRAHARS
jgi:5-aminolevulinate synthase